MAGKRRPAARAVRHNFKALVQKAFFPNLLQRPPFRFNIIVLVGDVRVLHIGPKAHRVREIFPHALIFPNALFAFFNKGLYAVCFNLLFAVQPQQFFHFQLYRQAMGVPPCFARHHIALHSAVTRNHIFDAARLYMADMRLAIGRGRAVIKGVGGAVFSGIDTFFKDIMFFPELFNGLFARDEIQACGHFFVHRCSSSFSLTKKPPCCKQGGNFRCTTYLLRTIIRTPGNGGVRLTAAFSPRLGRDIQPCATGAGLAPSPARFGVCTRLTGSVSAFFHLSYL